MGPTSMQKFLVSRVFLVMSVVALSSGRLRPSQALPCPNGCNCLSYDEGMVTACMDQGFRGIPENISNNTLELYLQGNTIPDLGENDFQEYPFLRTIVLTDSGIHNIHNGAFNGLGDLTSLDLRHNKIRVIRSYIFSSLLKLEKLRLDENRIRTIESYAFADTGKLYDGLSISLGNTLFLKEIQPRAFERANVQEIYIYNSSLMNSSLEPLRDLKYSLSMLFLTGNKMPLHISSDLFLGFKKLHVLNLENNGISDTSFLKYIRATDISLSHNPIGTVDFSRIKSMKNVRSLQLSNTGYDSINASYFSNMIQLSQINMSGNGITMLPEDCMTLFSRLQHISLSDNPLHCNCEMLWFKDWLKSARTRVEGAECYTPLKTAVKTGDDSLFTCNPPTKVQIQKQLDNGKAKLICSSNGDPLPNLTWIDPQNKTAATAILEKGNHDKTVSSAIFTEQQADKNGVYTCKASNLKGQMLSTIKLVNGGYRVNETNFISVFILIALGLCKHILC